MESIPARTAAGVALGVGDRPPKSLVRLVDPRRQLRLGERGRARVDAGRHPTARGRELEAIGAGLELLAHGAPDVIEPVGLAADEPAMPARHADDRPGGPHPRSGHPARGDRLAKADGHAGARSDVPHGGDARVEGLPGVRRGRPREVRDWDRRRALHVLGLGRERQVHVAVDEAGHERSTLKIDDLGLAAGGRASDGRDLASLQRHVDADARLRASAVEETGIPEDRPGRGVGHYDLPDSAGVGAGARRCGMSAVDDITRVRDARVPRAS
jgi:hypothetical protein